MPVSLLTDDTPFYIVLNAASGSGDAGDARAQMADILNAAGRRHEFLFTKNPSQLPEFARRAAEAAIRNDGAVIAAGGDGTINAVAQAALPTGRPFGIVPQGTFNYSSRAHSIPLDTADAVHSLLRARLKPIQIGLVNERVFLVNASLGLYPQILRDREHYKQQYGRKRVIAIWSALATLARGYRQLVLEIEHDGEREVVRTPTLFIGNNPLQLEQVGLPEAQDVQRRRLAGVIVRPVGPATLLWLGMRGALGQLGAEDKVRDFAFSRMTVHPRALGAKGVRVATDGEVAWMRPPLHFSVAPQPLMLMVPER
ncbi:MAG: diacylglycerol/lipid kinase family protein [Steroidobacter sp.]